MFTQYFSDDKLEKNEMGGACSVYGWEERRIQDLGGVTWRKETIWKTKRRWDYNIEMDIKEVEFGAIDWIEVAQDRDMWRAFVNAVMKLLVR